MVDRIKRCAKIVSEGDGFFMFLRAQLSSQLATVIDFVITIGLAKLFSIYYVYATFAGSFFGGVINCIVNYKWTFKSENCKKVNVAVKYILVWWGSLLLNVGGIYLLTEVFSRMIWVQNVFGHHLDDLFIIFKIVVSLIVAFFWNYNMQRIFVYKNHDLKLFFKRRN
ncbi:GtrA family protein [Coprobacter sp.]